MDHFKEEIIVRKKRGLFNLMLTLITLGMVAAGLFAAIYLMQIYATMFTPDFSIMSILYCVIFGAIVVGLFYVRVNCRVEFEYAFTNGELDVDKIVNGTKRSHLHSIDIRKIEKLAPVEDESYAIYDADDKMKRTYAVINRYTQTYFLVWGEGEEKQMLLMEPSQEMVRMMHLYNAKNIVVAQEPEE